MDIEPTVGVGVILWRYERRQTNLMLKVFVGKAGVACCALLLLDCSFRVNLLEARRVARFTDDMSRPRFPDTNNLSVPAIHHTHSSFTLHPSTSCCPSDEEPCSQKCTKLKIKQGSGCDFLCVLVQPGRCGGHQPGSQEGRSTIACM